ncbi:hypothetical protein GD1_40 [Paraglaciecola Antarctic GD virus 1]|nr:hypothetical protein GD1_40 [Paraglaciecola Antarctic GD virus 1]
MNEVIKALLSLYNLLMNDGTHVDKIVYTTQSNMIQKEEI